jgi:hypothetical protein
MRALARFNSGSGLGIDLGSGLVLVTDVLPLLALPLLAPHAILSCGLKSLWCECVESAALPLLSLSLPLPIPHISSPSLLPFLPASLPSPTLLPVSLSPPSSVF